MPRSFKVKFPSVESASKADTHAGDGVRIKSSLGWNNQAVLDALNKMFTIKSTEQIDEIEFSEGGVTASISNKI